MVCVCVSCVLDYVVIVCFCVNKHTFDYTMCYGEDGKTCILYTVLINNDFTVFDGPLST